MLLTFVLSEPFLLFLYYKELVCAQIPESFPTPLLYKEQGVLRFQSLDLLKSQLVCKSNIFL